jgi:LysM repeat protein
MQRLLEAVSYLKTDEKETVTPDSEPSETDIPTISVTEKENSLSAGTQTDEEDLDDITPKVVSRDTAEAESKATEEAVTDDTADSESEGEGDAEDDTVAEDTTEPVPESYEVQPGESLLSISHKFYGKDETKQICKLNGLEDENMIYAGQTLFLPAADNQ